MSRVPRAPKEVDTVLHQGRATKWTCVLVCVLLLSVSGTTLTYPEGTYSYSDPLISITSSGSLNWGLV